VPRSIRKLINIAIARRHRLKPTNARAMLFITMDCPALIIHCFGATLRKRRKMIIRGNCPEAVANDAVIWRSRGCDVKII